jgi:Tol biopolymer transport system component
LNTAAWLLTLVAGSAAWAGLSLGEPKPLSGEAGQAQHPAISPDGTQIAFVSDRDGVDNLFVMPLSGGTPVRLTREARPGVQIGNPHWSPRGDQIVYAANRIGGSLDLWLASVDGKSDERLTRQAGTEWMPAFSPDGATIAYVSDRDGTDALFTIGLDGSNQRKVLDTAYEPAFSPDGRRLAVYHIRGAQEGVFLVNRDGTGAQLVLEGGRMPTWSPDGRWLVAVKPNAAGSRLWLVDPERGVSEPVGVPAVGLAWPSWGARGGLLAYEARPAGKKQILVASLSAGTPLANIIEPLSGTTVRGAVNVRGRVGAAGGPVAAWRLEVGRGTGPTQWALLAEGRGPVEGALATWNAGGLEGAHTLRLTVVTDAGETTVATALVTVLGQYGLVWETESIPRQMSVGETYGVELGLRNNGTMTWRHDGPFAVYGSYQWLDESGRAVVAEGLTAPLPTTVGAGEPVVLKAPITPPNRSGRFTLRYDLRQGRQVWFHEQGAKPLEIPVTVGLPWAATIEVPSAPTILVPGQTYAVELRLTNRGVLAWQGLEGGRAPGPETVQVGTRWRDVEGGVVDTPPTATPIPQTVPAGQTAIVVAQVQAPAVAGRYLMSFDLFHRAGFFSQLSGLPTPTLTVTVSSPYAVQFLDHNTPGRVFPGDVVTVALQARNVGSLAWRAQGTTAIQIAYSWQAKDGRVVERAGLRTPLPYDVAPGQSAAFAARLQSPGEAGEYTLIWDLEQPGGRRFAELGNVPLKVPVMVGAPTHGARWEQDRHPVELVVGATYTTELRLTNIGSMTWPAQGADKVRVAYHWLRPNGEEVNATPIFTDLPKPVEAGETVRVTARAKAPDRAGRYMLKWDLYQSGYDYFSVRGAATLDVPVSVDVVYGARYQSHDTPARLVAGQRYRVNLRLQNTGTIPWDQAGAVPVTLTYRWYDATGGEVTGVETVATRLPKVVGPGESFEIGATLVAPRERGKYDLQWDLQFAGAFLFSEKGVEPLRVAVAVE